MRFAIFLESINFEQLDPHIRRVFLFDRKEEVITSIGEELVTLYDLNFLKLWLLSKKVEHIYVDGINKTYREQIEYIGIKVDELKSIRDNPILKNFKV